MNDFALSRGRTTTPIEAVDAEFRARELLLVMLGVVDATMHRRVREVVRYAANSSLLPGEPLSDVNEVLIISFEQIFTRAEVLEIVRELECWRA